MANYTRLLLDEGLGISYKKLNPQEIYINRRYKLRRGRPVALLGIAKDQKTA